MPQKNEPKHRAVTPEEADFGNLPPPPRARDYRSPFQINSALDEAFSDFLIDRRSEGVSDTTIRVYFFTIDRWLQWLQTYYNKSRPEELEIRDARRWLALLTNMGRSKNYIHIHARCLRAFAAFLHENEYIDKPLQFAMPKRVSGYRPYLTPSQLNDVLNACDNIRDVAVVLFMADSGFRADETITLNWEHYDIRTGIVYNPSGKGGKPRTSKVSLITMNVITQYRRLVRHDDTAPLFQTEQGNRFTYWGLRMLYKRLSRKTGIKVTAHAMRRTFATLSHEAGMDAIHIKELMDHATLKMTDDYIQNSKLTAMKAHEQYSPVANFVTRRRFRVKPWKRRGLKGQ